MIKPAIATAMPAVMCQVRSLNLPELRAVITQAAADTRYGGQVNTKVMFREKPSVLTTVGKKELKPVADKWQFCMNVRSQSRGSRTACMKPARAPLLPSRPTVSLATLAWASSRSSRVSHRVVRGWSGSRNMLITATPNVTAPSMKKSHLHPARPWAPSKVEKVAAAMRPCGVSY